MRYQMKAGIAGFIAVFCICATVVSADTIGSFSQTQYAPPSPDNGEILIDFDNSDSQSTIAAFLDRAGVASAQYSWFSREEQWVRVRHATASLMGLLRGAADVEGVEPNYYMSAFSVPNDPYYKYQWHLDQIGMRRAWDYPAGGEVTVAVIDTGIAYEEHDGSFRVEDLGTAQFVKPYNFVDGNEHANDDHGHGTHVAGTIAQLTNNGVGVAGVAPGVKLMPLKVLNASGYGTISDIAAAIRYAADNGAQVINMSLGGPFSSRILHKAVQYAHSKGVVIVCAAGNSSRSGLSYPAAYPECISVSAVRFDGTLAWYSSYGEGLTLAAPGGDMRVDQNGDGLMDGVLQNTLNPQDRTAQGYFLFQGTSMAAPHVAAVAALLMSQGITDPETVRDILVASATKVKDGTPQQYGAGIVNAAEALNSSFLKRKIRLAVFAFVLLVAILSVLNRGRNPSEKVPVNLMTLAGLILGSTGFFFLGFIPRAHHLFFLSHSMLEWPLGLGAAFFANPAVLSALPALLVVMLCYPWKRLIPFAVGFCAATAAFLTAQVLFPTTGISWIPGRLLESGWLAMHAGIALLLGTMASYRLK